MKRKSLVIIIGVIFLVVLCSFYLHWENIKLQVTGYDITSNLIPNEFDKYKIVQISDFHNTKSKTLTNDLIKEIDRQKPNVIVLTGDLIDAKKTNIDVAIDFVKEINDTAPIYFVPGNHEASTNEYDKLKEKLAENKVNVLDNKVEKLKINEAEINLIGITDPKMANQTVDSDSKIIKEELNTLEYDKSKYSILLSHRPELFDTYVEEDIDLVLTGHAHGGQIRLPFVGSIVAPNQGLFPKYTSGNFKKNKTTMIVSRGIGNSILPFRINNRPELVVIALKAKSKGREDNKLETATNINVIIDNKKYLAKIEDNKTAQAFVSSLPKTFAMKELNGNEKYFYMDTKLPTKAINPKEIKAGDIMLYGNNCIVIFYKSFTTTYSYTKIGHIDNLPDLGNGDITVTFEK